MPEFIVRHFAARLVALVGAADPVEEGYEEAEEEEEEEHEETGGGNRENGERTRKERRFGEPTESKYVEAERKEWRNETR